MYPNSKAHLKDLHRRFKMIPELHRDDRIYRQSTGFRLGMSADDAKRLKSIESYFLLNASCRSDIRPSRRLMFGRVDGPYAAPNSSKGPGTSP